MVEYLGKGQVLDPNKFISLPFNTSIRYLLRYFMINFSGICPNSYNTKNTPIKFNLPGLTVFGTVSLMMGNINIDSIKIRTFVVKCFIRLIA